MTHTADYAIGSATTPIAPVPVRMPDGGRMVIRGVQCMFGTALVIAAAGLWLVPGSSVESDVVLFKLALSIAAAMSGLGLLQAGATGGASAPAIEIDTIRREVRVVRRNRNASATVLQSCSFSQLGGAEIDGTIVRLWDTAGTMLAEVEPGDRKAFSSLVGGLRDEGKLIMLG